MSFSFDKKGLIVLLPQFKGDKMKNLLLAAAVVCLPCIDWTRLSGTVKAINLKDSNVTIQNRDGDLITIPVDYQVKITEKHDEIRSLTNLHLDEKITLIRIQSIQIKDETMEDMNRMKG